MLSIVLSIAIAFLIFYLACWGIGKLNLPREPFPIATVLYVACAVILILYLLRYV